MGKLGKFSDRGEEFAFRRPEEDARYNILIGSIRSTKTWQVLAKIGLYLKRYRVAGERVITGVSKDAIKHNVLNDLFDLVGPGNYSYNGMSGDLQIYGSKWSVVGAKDEGSEKYIRGRTVGIAICDELTLMPQSFFMMLIGRMSAEGARLYATTNTDSPYHWLKTDVLDNPDYEGMLWTQNYNLDDNLHLGREYVESIKRSYTGVWHRRFINAEWVLTEGAIYRDVLTDAIFYTNAQRPVGLKGRGGHVGHYLAVDYGTVNALAAGDFYDDGKVVWCDREYYWDSRVRGKQKTDAEYVEDLVQFVGGGDRRAWPVVIIDPSAASFKIALVQAGFFVKDAKNDVLDGIRRVSGMFAGKKLRINKDECPSTIRDMQAYSWDKKSGEKGKEQPIKSHDHGCFVAGTMIDTPTGPVPVESLQVGDWVSSPLGQCRIREAVERPGQEVLPWNGTLGTPDHPIFTLRGWIRLEDVRNTDTVCVSAAKGTFDPAPPSLRWVASVLRLANRIPGANRAWAMFPWLARFAAGVLASAGIRKAALVADFAARRYATVYSLRTEHGCYYANGVLVSNCDYVRYLITTTVPDWRLAA